MTVFSRLFLCAAATASLGGTANAATMTFVGIPDGSLFQATYVEDGITATSPGGRFFGFPDAGELHLDQETFADNNIYDFTFAGGAFDLVSLDISSNGAGAIGNLTAFDGADNIIAMTTFSADALGTITFTGLNGITRLRLVDTVQHFSIDNLVLNGSNAIPEPASWALLISGFGLLGAAIRFRRAPAFPQAG